VREKWSWPGVVATILGAAVGTGWAAALVISALSPHQTSPEGLELLLALGQTMAGAVAAWLGYQVGASSRNKE